MPQNARGPLPGNSSGPSLVIAGSDKRGSLPHQAAFRQAASRNLRFRRDVDRLHALGPRVLYEALCEFGADRLCRFEIEELVARYAALDPERVRIVGADRWPALPPLRAVP